MPEPRKTRKSCCCCGSLTPPQVQHWNRDTGYGLCDRCIDFCARRKTPADFESDYGKPGVNYSHAPTLPVIDGLYRT